MKSRVIRVFCFSSHIHNFCITSSIISSSISSSINSIISDDVIADVISDISKQPMSVVLLHIRKLKTSEMNHVWSSLKFTSNIGVLCNKLIKLIELLAVICVRIMGPRVCWKRLSLILANDSTALCRIFISLLRIFIWQTLYASVRLSDIKSAVGLIVVIGKAHSF